MVRLGDSVTLQELLAKFHSLYGRVLSADELLQKFYGAKQEEKETCADWACRLEECMYDAIEQDFDCMHTHLIDRLSGNHSFLRKTVAQIHCI